MHRFEFPEEIDMYKYTVTGLEEREAAEAAAAARGGEASDSQPAASSVAAQKRDPGQCKYYLKGIVVHSGTAFAGHYYSYIKVEIPWPLASVPLHRVALLVSGRSLAMSVCIKVTSECSALH